MNTAKTQAQTRTPMSKTIRIGILEDDPQMRRWLEHLVRDTHDMETVFSQPTLEGALNALPHSYVPDVCLVDLQLPDGSGTEFVKHIVQKGNSKALILTVLGDRVSVIAGLDVGASGYVLKDAPPEQILQSIRDVKTGANPLSAQVSSHLIDAFKSSQTSPAVIAKSPLTARETETLTLFAKGLSYKETASALDISAHTVRELSLIHI